MDFVVALPRSPRGNNTVWVIVDRLTKTAGFIPHERHMAYGSPSHGVPTSIVSDRDSRFLLNLCKRVQEAFGSELLMSTTFHPATDGQTKRTIQTLEDMLIACALEYQGLWEDRLDVIEFAYNNNYHAHIKMAQFEAS